jgi:hypothetical protein
MKKSMFRVYAALAMTVGAALSPTAAIAQGNSWPGWYFNDGAGTCGWIQCGPNGCVVMDTFPCPREVSGG